MLTRIAVLVSGGGTNLEHLLLAKENGEIPHGEFALVVSNKPDVYALTRAANHGVKSAVITGSDFEQKLDALLKEEKIDLIIMAGFLRIVSPWLIQRWEERIINIHPSLIPSFCGQGFYGLKVHEAALEYGVKVTGATVHLVNEIPDGGRILLQKAVCIKDGDTPEVLQQRVMEEAEWILLPQAAELMSKQIMEEKSK